MVEHGPTRCLGLEIYCLAVMQIRIYGWQHTIGSSLVSTTATNDDAASGRSVTAPIPARVLFLLWLTGGNLLVCSCIKIDVILTCSFAHVARPAGMIATGLSFSVHESGISYALFFTFIFYQGVFVLNVSSVLIDNSNLCIYQQKRMRIFRSHFITELWVLSLVCYRMRFL